MSKAKKQTYSVSFLVKVETPIEIQAESYEQALELARKYDVRDVVDFDTDYNDGSIEISSIWKIGVQV